MISLERRFLFVHIPKTGGNSIQNVLRTYSEDEIVCREPHQDGIERFELSNPTYGFSKHSPLAEYAAKLPPDVYGALFKFACVRNPWARAVSFYFSPHRGVTEFTREAFVAFLPTIPPMTQHLRATPDQPAAGIRDNFDYLMRFETLQQDFDVICERLGLPPQPLPTRNRSQRGRVEDYYDAGTVELVRQLFADDIALFGYDVPWAGA
ncbi:sulfotransferase family 2 domain-containing protein [Phenylobacterium sp. VNQ135]|uniref:sulfotransferase family 2 domain-containing protein n=1 Tax=Phenylobacterium sp. VNQ135 TaxID=3400922 RepID=UPI003C0C90D0